MDCLSVFEVKMNIVNAIAHHDRDFEIFGIAPLDLDNYKFIVFSDKYKTGGDNRGEYFIIKTPKASKSEYHSGGRDLGPFSGCYSMDDLNLIGIVEKSII